MSAAELAPLLKLELPYPGLRPFEAEEAFLFYGRKTHTEELLKRLAGNRFLAVVGTSGSGKSSLVRAGLMPALYRGFLAGTVSHWRIALMKPGEAPMANLAEALAGQRVPVDELNRSTLGLLKAVKDAGFAADEGLLIVADQFEELFRFSERKVDGGAEATLFVTSLLEAARASTAPIYVVLTMRADFLGECTQFAGLAEELNRSQYLIPRLTREQQREAIEKPVRIVNAEVAPRLVQRLLNELGESSGQLPVMQHALNRTFCKWREAGAVGEIDFEHYEAAHTVEGALNDHADELIAELPWAARPWTEKVFRCLTTTLVNGRAVRRPTRFDLLTQVLGIPNADGQATVLVREVIEKYAQRENSLLICSPPGELTAETVVDISHESLIACWAKLKKWVIDEASAASWYRSAAEDAARHARGEAPTWRDPKLSLASALINKGPWNDAWATRDFADCGSDFNGVRKFLAAGAAEQRKEKLRMRLAWFAIATLLVAALIALAAFAWEQRQVTELQRRLINSQQKVAALDDNVHAVSERIANVDQQLSSSGLSQKEKAELEQQRDNLTGTLQNLESQKVQAEKSVQMAAAAVAPDLRPIIAPPKPDQPPLSNTEKVNVLVAFLGAVLHEKYDSAWNDFSSDYQSKHEKARWSQELANRTREHGGGSRYHISTLGQSSGVCKLWYRDGSSVTLNITLIADGAKGAAISDFHIATTDKPL